MTKATPTTNKRVVLVYTTGAYAGLWQILGTTDDLKANMRLSELPPFVEQVHYLDHVGACSLVTVKPRYVLYRELLAPATRSPAPSFHPAQL